MKFFSFCEPWNKASASDEESIGLCPTWRTLFANAVMQCSVSVTTAATVKDRCPLGLAWSCSWLDWPDSMQPTAPTPLQQFTTPSGSPPEDMPRPPLERGFVRTSSSLVCGADQFPHSRSIRRLQVFRPTGDLSASSGDHAKSSAIEVTPFFASLCF